MKPIARIALVSTVIAILAACDSQQPEVSMATSPSAVAPKLSPETLTRMRAEMTQRREEFYARRDAEKQSGQPAPQGNVRPTSGSQ